MKLSKFINNFVLGIIFFSTFLTFFISLYFQFLNFQSDKIQIKNEFLELQKSKLKNEIDTIFKIIKREDEVLEELAKNSNTDLSKLMEIRKQNLLNWLANYKLKENGYIFVNSIDGTPLIFNGKLAEKMDKYPYPEIFKKQLEASKNPNGDFFNYKFKKINSQTEFDKISFVKKYDKYDWIIGTGVYLDEVDEELALKETLFRKTLLNQILSMFVLFILVLFCIYFISKKLSKYINDNVENLTLAFEKASSKNKKIDTNSLTFKEFISLANNLNTTLELKNRTKKELKDQIKIINENVIISTTDENGIITDASVAFCKMSGYTKEELIGRSHNVVKDPDTPTSFYEKMWNDLLEGKEWSGEIKNRKKNGDIYWISVIIKPKFKDHKICGYTSISTDITNKKFIEQLSITDELTKLYNRRFFNAKIEEEINRAKRENKFISLFILDVDYFKQYNDTYGHQEGDYVLQKISKVLMQNLKRPSDFAFRMGGEEFSAIFTISEEKNIYEFSENIRKSIEDLKIEHKKNIISPFVTISIGVVFINFNKNNGMEVSQSKLYKFADELLYKAKNQGRNRVYIEEWDNIS